MSRECKIGIIDTPESLHNSDSCCSIIMKKCDKKMLTKLQTPLELTLPNIFGDFDEEQELLIKNGSTPVIIVENASEFVSQMKDVHGFIEQIIDIIIQDNKKNYAFLGSHTFPAVLKEKWLRRFPRTDYDALYGRVEYNGRYDEGLALMEKYDEIIEEVRPKQVPRQGILHMALYLPSEAGDVGHYGIAIKNGNKVIVFDSMQEKGYSQYSALFSQIAEDIFDTDVEILQNPTKQTCPQPTGGFVKAVEGESPESYLYRLQNLDSQNHFCYLWAIWYFHVFVVHGEKGVSNIFQTMYDKCIPPLAVIKRYIWSVLHSFYPDDKKLMSLITEVVSASHEKEIDTKTADFLLRFFLLNFRYIWDDLDTRNFNLYSVIDCDLKKFRSMSNVNKCLEYSLQEFEYVLDKFT